MKMEGGKSNPFLLLGLLVILGMVIYYPSFKAPFVFDDICTIVEDYDIHLREISWDTLTVLFKKGRPVAYLSFALNYYFGKLNVFGYHVINLIIHILATLSFYLFFQTTLDLPSLKKRYADSSQTIALVASLLFFVHPVNTQAVTYIVQRMTSLAALFFLLCMLFYVRGRLQTGNQRLSSYAMSLLAALLAWGSKINSATLPVFIVIYEVYFFQEFNLAKIKKLFWYGLGLMVPLIYIVRHQLKYAIELQAVLSEATFSFTEKLLTELRVVVHYLSLLMLARPCHMPPG